MADSMSEQLRDLALEFNGADEQDLDNDGLDAQEALEDQDTQVSDQLHSKVSTTSTVLDDDYEVLFADIAKSNEAALTPSTLKGYRG